MDRFLILTVVVILINIPFGYWRESVRKFSAAWFVAVHAAVPIIVVVRLTLDVQWRLVTLPVLVAAYFAGQALGARWRRRVRAQTDSKPGEAGP